MAMEFPKLDEALRLERPDAADRQGADGARH